MPWQQLWLLLNTTTLQPLPLSSNALNVVPLYLLSVMLTPQLAFECRVMVPYHSSARVPMLDIAGSELLPHDPFHAASFFMLFCSALCGLTLC